ncbi:MAG: energy-coupling factor ABC transporter ATP-binding protein [Holophagaceae bacterium]|nr:energy-coupling factor ABC transporter ATP-binding protein [Holophagaceae bacterium]
MLTARDLTVVYPDGTKALDCISFTMGENETIALVGENGAGKTSLLLAIVGIIGLTGGNLEVNGVFLSKKTLREVRRHIGLVFQNPDDQLFMPLIYEDIAFGCRNLGMTEAQVENMVDGTLGQLNIGHLRNRSSLKLSGGEKRLAAIAAVLAMEPSILMFDEPTAYLDPRARRALEQTLNKLRHPKIVATHDMSFASGVCNRVIVLKGGKIVADGGPSLLMDSEFMRSCGL